MMWCFIVRGNETREVTAKSSRRRAAAAAQYHLFDVAQYPREMCCCSAQSLYCHLYTVDLLQQQ